MGDFPIKTSISSGFPIAMFDYQRVTSVGAWRYDLIELPSAAGAAGHGLLGYGTARTSATQLEARPPWGRSFQGVFLPDSVPWKGMPGVI